MPEVGIEDSTNHNDEDLLILRHAIKLALDQMKPKRKLIFKLSKFENLTYAEIAKHLQISERSVEDNIAKALIIIREELKSKNYDTLKY